MQRSNLQNRRRGRPRKRSGEPGLLPPTAAEGTVPEDAFDPAAHNQDFSIDRFLGSFSSLVSAKGRKDDGADDGRPIRKRRPNRRYTDLMSEYEEVKHRPTRRRYGTPTVKRDQSSSGGDGLLPSYKPFARQTIVSADDPFEMSENCLAANFGGADAVSTAKTTTSLAEQSLMGSQDKLNDSGLATRLSPDTFALPEQCSFMSAGSSAASPAATPYASVRTFRGHQRGRLATFGSRATSRSGVCRSAAAGRARSGRRSMKIKLHPAFGRLDFQRAQEVRNLLLQQQQQQQQNQTIYGAIGRGYLPLTTTAKKDDADRSPRQAVLDAEPKIPSDYGCSKNDDFSDVVACEQPMPGFLEPYGISTEMLPAVRVMAHVQPCAAAASYKDAYHYLPPEVMSDHCYGRLPSAAIPSLSSSAVAVAVAAAASKKQQAQEQQSCSMAEECEDPPVLNRNDDDEEEEDDDDDQCMVPIRVEPGGSGGGGYRSAQPVPTVTCAPARSFSCPSGDERIHNRSYLTVGGASAMDPSCSGHEFISSITSEVENLTSSLQPPIGLSNGALTIMNDKLPVNILEGEETDFLEQPTDVTLP